MRKIYRLVLICLLLLAACGAADTGAPSSAAEPDHTPPARDPDATPNPTDTPPARATATPEPANTPPARATPNPTNTPRPQPTATPAGSARTPAPSSDSPTNAQPDDALVQQARARLAQHLGIPADTLTFQSGSAENWSDSSLGCPDPGAIYLAVITPGYQLLFVNQAQTYAVHTNDSGAIMTLCEDGLPVVLPADASGA